MNSFSMLGTATCDVCGKGRKHGDHSKCSAIRKAQHDATNKTRRRAPRKMHKATASYITKIVA